MWFARRLGLKGVRVFLLVVRGRCWTQPSKNFVEEVITQIALIGCQNLGAFCVTVAWPSQRRRGGRALSDWGRKLEPTHPWAIFQLTSDFFKKKLLILKAWVFLLILTVLRLIKAPSRLFAEKLKTKLRRIQIWYLRYIISYVFLRINFFFRKTTIFENLLIKMLNLISWSKPL